MQRLRDQAAGENTPDYPYEYPYQFLNDGDQSGGGDGFYWVAYDLLRAGGNLATSQGLPVVFYRIKQDYTPKLAFKVTLTHDRRDQIAIMTGIAPTASATAPTKAKDYAGSFNFAGGPFPMTGRNMDATIEIGLDLTDLIPHITGNDVKFFLQIVSKGGPGQVKSFSLMDFTGAQVREIEAADGNKIIQPGATTLVSVPRTVPASIAALPRAPRERGVGSTDFPVAPALVHRRGAPLWAARFRRVGGDLQHTGPEFCLGRRRPNPGG